MSGKYVRGSAEKAKVVKVKGYLLQPESDDEAHRGVFDISRILEALDDLKGCSLDDPKLGDDIADLRTGDVVIIYNSFEDGDDGDEQIFVAAAPLFGYRQRFYQIYDDRVVGKKITRCLEDPMHFYSDLLSNNIIWRLNLPK